MAGRVDPVVGASPRELTIRPVTVDRWPDLVELFQRRGLRGGRSVTSGCWCMFWRLPRPVFHANWGSGEERGAGNRAELETLVTSGRIPGLLAYRNGLPIGWCSVGPRSDYPRLETSPALKPVDDQPVWSVVCFYIHRAHHGTGVAAALLQAAADHAAGAGARILEAYAVKPGDSDPFTGFEEMFLAAGFELARAGDRRSIMRLSLEDRPASG